MATPIRWDTIMSRGNPEGTNGINSAANLINNGIAQFQGVLKNTQDIDTANFKNEKVNNTAAFQDAVARYRSPEELQAAIGSGELDKLRSSLGPNIDRDAVRGAAQAQLSTLMSQKQKAIEFNHLMTDEATAMDVQNYRAAVLKGDTQGAAAAQAAYQAKNGRDLSSLATYADQRERQIVERGYADGEFTMKQERQKADIKHMSNQDAQDAARTALLRQQGERDATRLEMQGEDQSYTRISRTEEQLSKANQRLAQANSQNINTPEGQAALQETLQSLKGDPEAFESARLIIPRLTATPGMTVAAAKAAMQGIDPNWALNFQARNEAILTGGKLAKSPESILTQRLQNERIQTNRSEVESLQNNLQELRRRNTERYGVKAKNPMN